MAAASHGYEAVIGLEVHAQLLVRSKLFCGCATGFGAAPNTQVCAVCLALPGALPVLNAAAVTLAARAGLALGCTVRTESQFARKNYFYPDLAKGYQISQFDLPLNEHGSITISADGVTRTVDIQRIHMEEDAAKNLHGSAAGQTLVDFNRAGTPLIEIVSGPDLRSSAEAEEYLKRVREILMFVGANDGNLEEGSFRCDANVSVRPVGQEKLGTRCEIKNINSFRFVHKAIDYEIARQISVVSSGGRVVQETRGWSEPQGKTLSLRSKEEANDYRYFPDPDLPTVLLSQTQIDTLRTELPELPAPMRARFQSELGMTEYDAQVLTQHPRVADYAEAVARGLAEARKGQLTLAQAGKRSANFVLSELLRSVTTDGLEATIPLSAPAVVELLSLVEGGELSGKMAKDVLVEMIETGKAAGAIVAEKGLAQVSDTSVIEAAAQKVIADSPKQVEGYRAGKVNMLGYFVGQVMKATAGSANPKLVNDVLKKLLDG